MIDKFEFYDILGILVPGILTICFSVICFPTIFQLTAGVSFPDSFVLMALLALAIFLGHVIQGLSSLLEPILYKTWGGRPSERALAIGLGERYLPRDTGKRIRSKLISKVGSDASTRSLFLAALHLAESGTSSRVGKFNGLYAYHRALLTLEFISIFTLGASMKWGAASHLSNIDDIVIIFLAVLLVLLTWCRTKQRALYYVREVLLSAERELDSKA